jgi:hypothetical protein
MYTASISGSQPLKFINSDDLDERELFPFALKFLAYCFLQIETPKSQFNVKSTEHEQLKRIHQFFAFLLSKNNSGEDVTAVAGDFRLEKDPPVFRIYYAKNKSQLTKDDESRARALSKIIRDSKTKCGEEFAADICTFISGTSASKFQRMCPDFLMDAPIIATSLAQYIKSTRSLKRPERALSSDGDGVIVDLR